MGTATKGKLDQKTIDIVKSTVPVLEEHGEKITKRFYEMMFANHPELLNVFNQTNQKQGKQPRALANAVYAAAKYIDNLEAILPVVKQIAHKHRSLQIQPEHYPIVGEHLLLAIKDVLGDAATDDIIEAWGIAYGEIADVFISVEKEMYDAAEQKNGGWKGYRTFQVERKVKESDVITSFYLKPADGKPIADFQPGQYITVQCDIPGETYTHVRQYSLSDAPGKDYYRISVKREDSKDDIPAGIVSTYLHQEINEGDTLEITAPAGDFVLNTDHELPIVLISGGVGLTPMMSMFNTIAEQHPEKKTTFIHAAINGNLHAMDDHAASLAQQYDHIQYYVCYENPTEEDRQKGNFQKEGFVDLDWLKSILDSKEAVFYFCGPLPFMKAVNNALKEWNVPADRINFEFFGPAAELN